MLRYLIPLLLLGAAVPSNSCLVLGADVARQIAKYKPQCDVVAVDGRSSARINDNVPTKRYAVAYVVAGTNDPLNPKLGANLFSIRRKLNAGRVTWVAPYPARASQRVYETAVYFKDGVVYLSKFKQNYSKLGHPKDYKAVAKALK